MYPRSAYPSDVFLSKIIFFSGLLHPLLSFPFHPLPLSLLAFSTFPTVSIYHSFGSLDTRIPPLSLSPRVRDDIVRLYCVITTTWHRLRFCAVSAVLCQLFCGWKIFPTFLSFCNPGKSDSVLPARRRDRARAMSLEIYFYFLFV